MPSSGKHTLSREAGDVVSDFGFFLGVVTQLALVVAVPVLLLLVLRAVISGGVRDGMQDAMGGAHRDDDPLTILQRRFARGEIDEAEYAERRRILTGP